MNIITSSLLNIIGVRKSERGNYMSGPEMLFAITNYCAIQRRQLSLLSSSNRQRRRMPSNDAISTG